MILKYYWSGINMETFLTYNTLINEIIDNKNRHLLKIKVNGEMPIFKTPLQFKKNNISFQLERKKKYKLIIYGYSDIYNCGYILFWVHSINKENNKQNLEFSPTILRKQSNKNELPNISYDFYVKNNINIWFGLDLSNSYINDMFYIYKIELLEYPS